MNLSALLAKRTQGLQPSPIRKLVPLMRKPGMISLGGGYPNAKTFAFQQIDVTFTSGTKITIADKAMELACQYGPTDIQPELKPYLLSWHKDKDQVTLTDDQVQVLNGAQEGLHIAGYLFLEQGDTVIVSEPAYPGALGAFGAFTNSFLAVPLDEHGTDTSALENILSERINRGLPKPKFIYEVPNGHNPAGVTLSLARRKELLRIASRFDLLILEDDPYQLLKLDNAPLLPSLQSLDTEQRVLRLDSFSKIFAPGLRIGYASGPADIIAYFRLYKQGTNLHTSAMVQMLLMAFLEQHGNEGFRRLIRKNCELYRQNRDVIVAATRAFLPPDVKFTIPSEGMFLWFQLPEGFDAHRMVETDGLALGILMVPGYAFSTTNGLKNCMRASYSMVTSEQIQEGIRRFAVMIDRERKRLA